MKKPKQKPLVKAVSSGVIGLDNLRFTVPTIACISHMQYLLALYTERMGKGNTAIEEKCAMYTAWQLATKTLKPRALRQTITKAEACVLVHAMANVTRDVYLLNLKGELHRLL